MLNKRIGMLVLSSVLSMGMLVGCKNQEVDNQVQEQQIQEEVQEEVQEEKVDDTDGGKYLSSSEISDEEIIAKTKDYWYCDSESFIKGYRTNYNYRNGNEYGKKYKTKEDELCEILDWMTYDETEVENFSTIEKYNEYYIECFSDIQYGQLLRYIDYLEESNQTDSECYKLAIEVRDIYNGEIIDIEYFNRAKEIREQQNQEQESKEEVIEQPQVQEEQEEIKEETVEYSVDDIKSLMNETNIISVRINKAKRSGQYVDVSEEVNQLDIIYQEAKEQRDKYLNKNSEVACAYTAIMRKIEVLKQMIPCTDQNSYNNLQLTEAKIMRDYWDSIENLE